MKIEVRADGATISGYVNVTGKLSRPVITPHGKVIETVEERAFEKALAKGGIITVNVDHDSGHAFGSTSDGSLALHEDAIGLHATVTTTDPTIINLAKTGKIKGWSFGMYNVDDTIEERAENLPLRHIKALDLDHVSIITRKTPVYSATSIEVRAGAEETMEIRAIDGDVDVKCREDPKPEYDNGSYKQRLEKIKERVIENE